MSFESEIVKIIGQAENSQLEYKSVLPPSRNVARMISSFANADGGYIILGVSDKCEINGLSGDVHANSITHKAIDLLSPKPHVLYQHVSYKGKNIYAIKVEKSDVSVGIEGKFYKRIDDKDILQNPTETRFKQGGYPRVQIISQKIDEYKHQATGSKIKLIEHYQSILKIIDDLGYILFPTNPATPTTNQEGKILTRILYSSFVDNFETYLSDLLFEIFLAKPTTLKSSATVTVKEVLDCSDLQEFISYLAKQKISKLQKGSVK